MDRPGETYDGFRCSCGGLTRVIRSRPWQGGCRQVRECTSCGHRRVSVGMWVTADLIACGARLGLSFDRQDIPEQD